MPNLPYATREQVDAAAQRWLRAIMLLVQTQPEEADPNFDDAINYHEFWELWKLHKIQFRALAVSPEHKEFVELIEHDMYDVASAYGFMRSAADRPPRRGN